MGHHGRDGYQQAEGESGRLENIELVNKAVVRETASILLDGPSRYPGG